MQGQTFELDEEMCAEDEEREGLQEIINNTKLSEGYLTLARDIEVMEAKTPDDIYKVCIYKFIVPSSRLIYIYCCVGSLYSLI